MIEHIKLRQKFLPSIFIVLLVFLIFGICNCAGTPETITQNQSLTTTQNQSLLNRHRGVAQITYLGWSGWAIQTKNHFLIFDDITGERYINLHRLADANVFVFISHGHSDHYNNSVYNLKKQIKKIHYVSGNSDTSAADTLFMGGRQEIQVDDVKITSIQATDGGVGFLVEVDDLVIFHAGDHANWDSSFSADYYLGINYLAKKVSDIDLMFMPIATGYGEMRESIYGGVIYAIGKLRPKAMLPMHGTVNLLQTFTERYEKEGKVGMETKIYSPKMNGKVFTYLNGLIF